MMIAFLLLPLLAVPVLSSLEKLSCYAGNIDVDLTDGRKAHVSEAEVSAFFQRDNVRVYAYPDTKEANIQINETSIFFKGNLSIGSSYTAPGILNQGVYYQMKGVGKLKKHHHKAKLTKCKISFVNVESKSWGVPQEVENEFERILHYCVGYQICAKIGTVQPEDYAVPTNPDDFESIYVYPEVRRRNRLPRSVTPPEPPTDGTKKDVALISVNNAIFDMILASIITSLKGKHEETITIDDIKENFSVVAIKGHFDAKNGHFSDLTTLKRTNDVVFERKGSKFSISGGLGLSTARIGYNNYEIKYGAIKVRGNFSADVRGIAIDSKLSVDYNQHPCKAELQYFKISQFGKGKINFTGLGKLSKLSSNFATWISKTWHDNIANFIESKVTSLLQVQLNNLNCEKYRAKG